MDHSFLGGILVLIGGILAVIFSVSRMAFGFLMRRMMMGSIRTPMMWGWFFLQPHVGRGIRGFMIIGVIVSLVLGIIAIYAYTRVKRGKVKNGGLIAIVVGIMMLLSTNWIAGVMTLVGGIICYVSKPATPNSPQSA